MSRRRLGVIRARTPAVKEAMNAFAPFEAAHARAERTAPIPVRRLPMTMLGEVQGSSGGGLSQLIVDIAQRGDREAFATLFNHFAPRVKSYLLRLGATAESAEELSQEALLTVWRRAPAFDPSRAAASTWIFTIARNLRIDVLRKDRRPPLTEDPCAVSSAPILPDAALAAGQDEARIGRAIADLPGDQARVVRLAFFSDKPHSEIAAELGLPLGTVKSRLRLAMSRLRIALGELS